jgi:hypothetical protein
LRQFENPLATRDRTAIAVARHASVSIVRLICYTQAFESIRYSAGPACP